MFKALNMRDGDGTWLAWKLESTNYILRGRLSIDIKPISYEAAQMLYLISVFLHRLVKQRPSDCGKKSHPCFRNCNTMWNDNFYAL